MTHEWHVEQFTPKGSWVWDQDGGLPARLSELESQGFEIFSVSLGGYRNNSAYIVYRSGR